MQEIQFLGQEQTTSDTFSNITGIVQVTVEDHAGGTWTLQRRAPSSDTWIDLDVTFVAEGSKVFYASEALIYRLDGGTVGAKGWYIEIPLHTVTQPNREVKDLGSAVMLR